MNRKVRLIPVIFLLSISIFGTICATPLAYALPNYRKIYPGAINAQDYPSIQEAIDSLPSSGGAVFIPAGIYILSTPIKVRANITLIGESFETYLKLADGANCSIIENMNQTGFVDVNISILNMQLDGNKAYQTAPINGIYLSTAPNARIENVWAHDFPKYTGGGSMGIWLLVCPNSIVRYNIVENNDYTGIMLSYSNNSEVSYNKAYHNHRGIYVSYTSHTRVMKNTVIDCDEGIRLYGSASHNRIQKNYVENSIEEGIVIMHPQCVENFIVANYLKNNLNPIIDWGTETKIRGNRIIS